MQVGVFIPIANNGWLISKSAPQYMPNFEMNKEITLRAERHGLDFVLSMIKFRGFGGETEFWNHALESFTLMAGLAAVTTRIRLFATAASLVMPPAIVARMAATIDSIAPGRFGVNLVTGWQRPEYSQMGLWPGDDHFATRYDFLTEYATVLRDLLGTGVSDHKGDHFAMEDCRVSPIPAQMPKIICAGSSDKGMEFSARFADYNFCFGKGVNTPTAFAPTAERLIGATAKTGRDVSSFVLFMVICADTDEAAWAKWQDYNDNADTGALAWLGEQVAADTHSAKSTNVKIMADKASPVNINMGTLVGSPATIARMLDQVAGVPGMGGVLLTFDDFLEGVDTFGTKIQPLMQTRQALEAAE